MLQPIRQHGIRQVVSYVDAPDPTRCVRSSAFLQACLVSDSQYSMASDKWSIVGANEDSPAERVVSAGKTRPRRKNTECIRRVRYNVNYFVNTNQGTNTNYVLNPETAERICRVRCNIAISASEFQVSYRTEIPITQLTA